MAGYSKISATSTLVQIKPPTKSLPHSVYQITESDQKIYIPTFLNKFRVIGCVDSGSDLTLIQTSLFKKIFGSSTKLDTSDITHITSFSNHTLTIQGKIQYRIRLHNKHPGIPVNIYVVPDIPNVPTLLLGNDMLKSGLGLIAYTGTLDSPLPEVIFKYPEYYACTVYYEKPSNSLTCMCNYELDPYETMDVMFELNPAAPVIKTDYILITSQQWGQINIIPSKSDLEFDYSKDCYLASGRIANLTNKHIKGTVTGKIELVNTFKAIPLTTQHRIRLKHALKNNPVGREVLPIDCYNHINIPIVTVNNINLKIGDELKISDFDLADTVMSKEPDYTGEAKINDDIIETQGLDIPTIVYKNAAEAIDLTLFSEEIRPYIEDIFIKKYPEVVALHSLDAGNISLTLGLTQLRLREGEVLPRSKRIFHVSPTDQRHLDDICELLIKFGYIMRAPVLPNGNHLYGMSAYLIPRSKPNCLGRLIVDFSPVNQLIQSPPNVIPEISATLQFLQGKALYSSLDLKYAYMALRIDEDSRPLTTFLTPTGSFQWLSLPTGAANSPAYFTDACDKILHSEPVRDENGNPIYETKNIVKLKRDPLKLVTNYFDDILITSILKPTYKETVKAHFKEVEKVISRLAFHHTKVSVVKCEFAKSKILFLGWWISHDYILADPRRIEKVKDFKFPESKKNARAFLGLVNSLRRVTNLDIIKELSILSPLTSSKAIFQPTTAQRAAFEKVKKMLISEPLFTNLIDEKAEKYLWVDAATSSGVLGAVLAQKKMGKLGEKFIPECLDLDDEVHRIIFDKELKYEPAMLYTCIPNPMPKPSHTRTIPPKITLEDKLLGFTPANINDSFFWSTISIFILYGCKVPNSTLELRKMAMKNLRKGILNNKLKDFVFKLNYENYSQFVTDFLEGKVGMDPELLLAESLAQAMHRPMVIISSLKKHNGCKIFQFNWESDKPPLVYGLYQRDQHEIFKPFFHNKHVEFKLDVLKGKIQIIAYMAKTVPETFKSRPILDLEVFAILTALHNLQRFISGVKVTLLSDSRVLFYLFSPKVGNSSVKIKRWCLKLLSDYPLVNLHFVKTTENLADFLTREGMLTGDLEKLNIHDVTITNFHEKLPKETFTLAEWIVFVENHPEYLTINTEFATKTALTINKGLENIKDTITPIDILKDKLSRAKIVQRQKIEFADIYSNCLASQDFEYTTEHAQVPIKYKLVSDLLMVYEDFYKILMPPSMIGLLLSHTHLIGHKGLTRMLCDLESYSFHNKYTVVKQFVTCCYSCFLTQTGTKKSKIGIYPTPTAPFQEISMDLAENLNQTGGYSHLLVVQCILTDFTIIAPLKSKSSSEVTRVLLYNVLQNFNVHKIHSDNGPAFRSKSWLEIMAALNITIINTSALHPAGRGQIERLVGTIKLMMKKMLATKPTFNWEYIPYLVAKILNNTISPKTNFTPAQMVFGYESNDPTFNLEIIAPPHALVKNHRIHIDKLSADIKEMTNSARDRLTQLKLITNEKLNKNKVTKSFKVNDYVFVLDRANIPGNPRPLHTKLQPSPYIVVRPLFTTTLVKRLADGFITLYSNNDLKVYKGGSPLFKDLPPEISKILLHSFTDLLASDLTTITKFDNLDIPTGIQLYDPLSHDNEIDQDQLDHDNDQIKLLSNVEKTDNNLSNIVDEFEPEKEPTDDIDPVDDPDIDNIVKNLNDDQLLEDLKELQTKNIIETQEVGNDSEESEEEAEPEATAEEETEQQPLSPSGNINPRRSSRLKSVKFPRNPDFYY